MLKTLVNTAIGELEKYQRYHEYKSPNWAIVTQLIKDLKNLVELQDGKKQNIIEDLENMHPILKDYNTFKHLFSEDNGEATLARLYQQVSTLKNYLSLTELTSFHQGQRKMIEAPLVGGKLGDFVSIRLAGGDDNKTYIGILLGSFATHISAMFKENSVEMDFSGHNPAIYIPDLKRIVFGYESWWGKIESLEEFRKITTEDIENTWYVKLLQGQWLTTPEREMKNPALKVFQIGSDDGDKEWVAAENTIKALILATNTLGYSLYDIEEGDIKEIPKIRWKDFHIEDEAGNPYQTFEDYVYDLEKPDIIATTNK